MPEAHHLEPGKVFGDDFRIVRPLSAGGMGAVYVAEQISTNRLRALKLMRVEIAHDAKLRERFVREAKVGARIASDHVVQVIAAGVDGPTGAPWLAMELLEGEDLRACLNRRGVLPPGELITIFEQLCHALGAAHDAQVVHRDLKPENIFLAVPRLVEMPFAVKVLDFGIARVQAESQSAHATGAMGTLLWMAPEQTEVGGNITPATDIWPLGLIAFRALVGASYWRGGDDPHTPPQAILRSLVIDRLPLASERAAELGRPDALPPEFDAWFARCVRREIPARFRTVREAMSELTAILRSHSSGATTPERASSPAPTRQPPSAPSTGTEIQHGPPGPLATLADPRSLSPKRKRGIGRVLAIVAGLAAVAAVVVLIARFASSSAPKAASRARPSSSQPAASSVAASSVATATGAASSASAPLAAPIIDPGLPFGCTLWEEKRPSQIPNATSLIQMRLCRKQDTVTGWQRFNNPAAGFVERELSGRVESGGKKVVVKDVKFIQYQPRPGYVFCLTERYELDLVPPDRLSGFTLDSMQCAAGPGRKAPIDLRRALDDKGVMVPVTPE